MLAQAGALEAHRVLGALLRALLLDPAPHREGERTRGAARLVTEIALPAERKGREGA